MKLQFWIMPICFPIVGNVTRKLTLVIHISSDWIVSQQMQDKIMWQIKILYFWTCLSQYHGCGQKMKYTR